MMRLLRYPSHSSTTGLIVCSPKALELMRSYPESKEELIKEHVRTLEELKQEIKEAGEQAWEDIKKHNFEFNPIIQEPNEFQNAPFGILLAVDDEFLTWEENTILAWYLMALQFIRKFGDHSYKTDHHHLTGDLPCAVEKKSKVLYKICKSS